jgi:hypothetical protein
MHIPVEKHTRYGWKKYIEGIPAALAEIRKSEQGAFPGVLGFSRHNLRLPQKKQEDYCTGSG